MLPTRNKKNKAVLLTLKGRFSVQVMIRFDTGEMILSLCYCIKLDGAKATTAFIVCWLGPENGPLARLLAQFNTSNQVDDLYDDFIKCLRWV